MLRLDKLKTIFLFAVFCVISSQLAYAQTTLFSESFDGSANDDLGTSTNAAWITAFSRANGGSDNNAVTSIFGADGSIDKVANGASTQNDAGALIAIDGGLLANSVYTLTVTIDNNNTNWTAVGFASSDNNLVGANGRHSNGNNAVFGGYAWALTRNLPTGTNQEIFNGIGTGGANSANGSIVDPTQPVTITIALDTTDTAAVTAEYYFNGTSIAVETLAPEAFADISHCQ